MSTDQKTKPGWLKRLVRRLVRSQINIWTPSETNLWLRWSLKLRIFRNKCLILRNNLLILYHKALYRFYLCTKRDGLPLHRIHMRRRLVDTERQLVAKYGCDWRLRVFDDE